MATRQQYEARGSRARWRKIRPRSVTGLLLASFILVAVPLLAATLYSVFYVDQLSSQSERLVLRGVETARASKKLDTILTDMERDARQYKILDKPVLVQNFLTHKALFDKTLATLGGLELKSIPSWNLDTLAQQAGRLAAAMHAGAEAIPAILDLFGTMHREVAVITRQGNAFIDAELKQLRQTADEARRFLLLCLVMLIPGVILLAGIFTVVISRPVRQIASAIDRLGSGDFSKPVHVSAPSSELDTLGRQLDWMRQQLATLEDERNQFMRRMSHDLKTPLASIREGADLLHDGTVGALDSAQMEVAEIIRHNSIDLMLLIENLLDFSAWQQQQAKLEYQPCELKTLSETVIRRQQLSIKSKNLNVLPPDHPIELVADRDRIHLIIDNLMSNAIKFSPERGTIRVQAAQNADEITLAVSDEGPGINPGERDLIFEAFYRGASQTQDFRTRGTGIGLSVVNECVKAHGGRINVRDNRGGGACIEITLPNGASA